MKRFYWISILFVAWSTTLSSCKKEVIERSLPIITTDSITNITETTATSGGKITSDGNCDISACGICWSKNVNPTIDDSVTIDNLNEDSFLSQLNDLTYNSKYYLRAYATNCLGTAYGEELEFTTSYDSISLKYMDLGDGVKRITLFDTLSVYIYDVEYTCGIHQYTCWETTIYSSDPTRLKVSYGHDYPFLYKDSVIDESLDWLSRYPNGGWRPEIGFFGIESQFVGIKYFEGNEIYYGWIHTPHPRIMTEYAIDTSSVHKGVIRAGCLKK